MLEMPVPLALRNVTLKDVLTELSDLTGIRLCAATAELRHQEVPYFINTGNGFQSIKALATVFRNQCYLWRNAAMDYLCWYRGRRGIGLTTPNQT